MSLESPRPKPTEAEVDEADEARPAIDAIATAISIGLVLGMCLIALAVVGALAMALVWVAVWVERTLGLPAMPMVLAFFGIVISLGVWLRPRHEGHEAESDTLDEAMRGYLLRLVLRDYERGPEQRRKQGRGRRSSRTRRTPSRSRTASRDG